MFPKNFWRVIVPALFLIAGVAALLGVLLVDSDRYRDVLIDYVERKTDRRISINGEFRASIGMADDGTLELNLAAGDVVLYNRVEFSNTAVIRTGWLETSIGLVSLLTGQPDVRTVLLERPQFDLVRLVDGRSNWRDLALLVMAPAGYIHAYAGRVRWRDQTSDTDVELTDLNWNLTRSESASAVQTDLSFMLAREGAYSPLTVRVSGRASVLPQKGWDLTVEQLTGNVTGKGLTMSLEVPTIRVDLDSGSIQAPGAEFTIGALGIEAHAAVMTLDIDGEHGLIEAGSLKVDLYAGRFEPTIFAESISADLSGNWFAVPALAVRWQDAEVLCALSGSMLLGEPMLQGSFRMPMVDLHRMLQQAGIEPDRLSQGAFGSVSLASDFKLDPNHLRLDKIELGIDGNHVTGWVQRAAGRSPRWSFALEVDELELAGALQGAFSEASSSTLLVALAADQLKGVRAQGRIGIQHLRYERLSLHQVDATVRSEGNLLAVLPITGKAYGGTVKAALILDRRQETPVFLARQTVKNLRVGDLLQALTDIDIVSAVADLSATVRVEGADTSQLLAGTRGVIRLKLKDGRLPVNEFKRLLRQFDTDSTGQPGGQLPVIGIDQASATVRIDNGVVRNADLDVSGQGFWLEGKGAMSLRDQTIDYRVIVGLGDNKSSSGRPAAQILPFLISGSSLHPRVRLDIQELIRRKIEQEVAGSVSLPKRAVPDRDAVALEQQLEHEMARLQQTLSQE